MDRLKRGRRNTRLNINKDLKELETEMKLQEKSPDKLQFHLASMMSLWTVLQDEDQEIMNLLLDSDASDAEVDTESEEIREYQKKVGLMKLAVERALAPVQVPEAGLGVSMSTSTHSNSKYKLQKLEGRKFSGEYLDWLSWWSYYEKIHEDDEMDSTDKFQYLIQYMTKGTRAEKIVNSYPVSRQNYPKVVEALRKRYANKRILKELYVRQLIKMVMYKPQEKKSISTIYDELESNLRSLESLGLDPLVFGDFLYPLVESSLPVDIVQVWQRS